MLEAAYTLDDITVIIVTYNSAHCIELLATDLAGFAHVIVSDNASEDETQDAVQRKIPQARLLQHARNLGYGAANNRALEQVTTRFAFLLNPDCQISTAAALGMLAIFSSYPQAAAVAPQLLRSNGAAEISYRWPGTLWASRGGGADATCSVGFVCAAAVMLKMPLAQNVGGFDEDFFLYYEDEDLCLRLFQAQQNILVAPQIQLTHASRGSVRGNHPLKAEFGRGYHHAQSKILFAKKHVGQTHASKLRNKTLALALLSFSLRLLVPLPKYVARHAGRIAGLLSLR